MKKLLALFLLIVAASVAAPGFLGMQAEERYDAAVAQLRAAGYRVVDETYARGWFRSDARLQLEFPLPEGRAAGAEPPRVLVKTRAVHGPFLGDLAQPFGLARLDTEIWVDSAPLVVGEDGAPMRTFVGFLGSATTSIRVPARQLPLENGTLETSPIEGELQFGAGDRIAVGWLSVPSLRARGPDGAVGELAGLEVTANVRSDPAGVPLGEWRVAVERMAFEVPAEAKAFALAALEVSGSSELRDGAIDVAADYRLGSVTAEGETYGPFDLRLAARRLAADALALIQAAGQEAAAAGATPEERSEALGIALLANADTLLAKDPSFAVEHLTLELPAGRVAASLEVRAVGLRVAELRDPAAALQRVEGKAALRLPAAVLDTLLRQQGRQQLAALAEQQAEAEQPSAEEVEKLAGEYATRQVEVLVAQQLLVRDGGDVTASAELRNGLLTLNGKSIPIGALLPPPAGAAH